MKRDLEGRKWIYLKAILFGVVGISCAALLIAENPGFKTALLICLMIWSFCRIYYFAFYVIEKYVDPSYRFSGLGSFLRFWWGRR